jgi:hypothetical protein
LKIIVLSFHLIFGEVTIAVARDQKFKLALSRRVYRIPYSTNNSKAFGGGSSEGEIHLT